MSRITNYEAVTERRKSRSGTRSRACRKKTDMPRHKFHANVEASIPSAPGTQLMMSRITNYEAVSDAFDRRNRSNRVSNQVSHIVAALLPRPKPRSRPRSKTEAAEPASLSRSPTDCDTCGNLCRRGVGVFDTPISVREVCQKQTHYPESRGNFSERPECHEGPVRAR